MQLSALFAASALLGAASASHVLERRQAFSINKTMPAGNVNPPAVSSGGGNDPWVTYLDPWGNWHTQQVYDPSTLLNGNYVVTAIGGVNICSGNWGFLYLVNTADDYPSCQGNYGSFNAGDTTNGGRPGYNGLTYGTCPVSVYHYFQGKDIFGINLPYGGGWGAEGYSNCWTGYWNWDQNNDGTHGTSKFNNGMKVGYCCFN